MQTPCPSDTDALHGAVAPESLERLEAIAADFGADQLADEVRTLAGRVGEGQFYVACVGQFKRGKSTLLDALLGERILPTGVVPVTTVPTVVRFGHQPMARIRAHRGAWREVDPATLEEYVSEDHNPGNALGIDAVEVLLPSALLAGGLCLVDTPGISSVLAHNTKVTRDFVPHIDVALVVIGADPPLSGDELELVEAVARQVPDLIFVLNKADRVREDERDQATAFARRVLERRLERSIGPIFQVSAAERLDRCGPERDWPAFVGALEDLARSGSAIAQRAEQRGISRLVTQLLVMLDAERIALLRPIEDSESRIEVLGRTIADANDSLAELGHRLVYQQHTISQELAARRDAFLRAALPAARDELDVKLRPMHRLWGPALRRQMMDSAQEVAKRHVLPWLGEEQARAEDAYRRTTARFVEMANDFLRRLAASTEPEFGVLPGMFEVEHGFRVRSEFCFNELLRIAHPASPVRYALDALLGLFAADGHLRRDAERFLVHVVSVNAARVQSDLDRRVSESRRRLEADIRTALTSVRAIAERALGRARTAQAAGELRVRATLEHLQQLRSEVEAIGSRPA